METFQLYALAENLEDELEAEGTGLSAADICKLLERLSAKGVDLRPALAA